MCHCNVIVNVFFLQILEAADRIQASDMKRHALNIIIQNFRKVNII